MHLGHCTRTPDAESEEENNDHLRQEGLTLLEKAAALGLKEVRQGCRCLHIYFFSDAAKIGNVTAGYTPKLVFPSYSLLKSLALRALKT